MNAETYEAAKNLKRYLDTGIESYKQKALSLAQKAIGINPETFPTYGADAQAYYQLLSRLMPMA